MGKARKTIAIALVLLMVFTLFTPMALAGQHPFNDVADGRWYSEAVQFVYENGIMGGVGNNRFNPQGNLTRAEITALIFRLHHGRNANADDNRDNNFSDVAANRWFAPYVTWASNNNIDNGIGQNQFAPNRHASRQEFATMMFRYAQLAGQNTSVPSGFNLNQFTDHGQIASGSLDAMKWANYNGIITGRTTTTLVPQGTLTRAEAATIFMRFMNIGDQQPPVQQRIDLRDLMGVVYHEFLAQYGHLLGEFSYSDFWGIVSFSFPDVSLGLMVVNSIITSANTDGSSDLVHLGGIGYKSTQNDIVATFGQPAARHYLPAITYYLIVYEYTLPDGNYMSFTISTNTGRVINMTVFSKVEIAE